MKGRFKAATGRVIYVPATSIFQGQVPKTRTTVRENVPSIMHKRKRAYAIFSQCAYEGSSACAAYLYSAAQGDVHATVVPYNASPNGDSFAL